MNPPPYRLLACDLDGTLLRHDFTFSARVHRAIERAQACGVIVTLATGRSFQSTRPFAKALNIQQPLLCYQGGLIQHSSQNMILRKIVLPPELVEETIRLSEIHQWQLLLYMTDLIALTEYRYPADLYSQMMGPTVRLVADLRSCLDAGAIKLTIMAEEPEAAAIEMELKSVFQGQMEILRSHPMFVEGIPYGASKGAALAWCAQFLNVDRHEVMAIGDQDNDADMLAWSGWGIAMGNGSRRCQDAAAWIAPAIEEDGAAAAIERFLL